MLSEAADVARYRHHLGRFLSRAIGPAAFGRAEYFLAPTRRQSWGGPLNGQQGRVTLCGDIFDALQPAAIVETGTFRGTTTNFFAQLGAPVYTVEAHPQYYAFARSNTRKFRDHIRMVMADSRSFLRTLANDDSVPKSRVFFYLDAHWNSDLPLAEELDVIFSNWENSVIMVDDFEVPGDSYGYDDYGSGAALNKNYLDRLGRTDMFRFFPSLPAAQESGSKRGCVVLCNSRQTQELLARLGSLRSD